jgi:hypothetical protein
MLAADRVIAGALMALSVYFMWHATVLPIGWVEGEGPGGGAFPFWLSAIMFVCAGAILLRSFRLTSTGQRFFDPETRAAVLKVTVALLLSVAVMGWLGTYVAIPAFIIWFVRFQGGHSWRLTLSLAVGTVLVLFFFFEVALRTLLPKGITEPLFFPLYQLFF